MEVGITEIVLNEQVYSRVRAAIIQKLGNKAVDFVDQLQIILVSNETGLGVIPLGALSRRFVDASGELHQSLAAMCDRVTLAVAGLPFPVKGTHT